MSHAATKWAFDQPRKCRDMKPNEWAVLVVLADCHNPVHGCFPSVDHIVDSTNLSERSVRDQLGRLRERGLINWDDSREGNRRGANRYRLAFEDGFEPANLAASSDASTGKSDASEPANPDALNRQNLPPNLVTEPVREPVTLSGAPAREAGSERESEAAIADREAERNREAEARRRWQRLKRDYPGAAVDDLDKAERLFLAAAEADQVAMLEALPRWSAFLETQRRRPPVQDFISGRRWELIPEAEPAATPQAAGGKGLETAAPYVRFGVFDQGWWAMIWRAWRAGDFSRLSHRLQPEQLRHGISVKSAEAPPQGDLDALVRVAPDSPEAKAWLDRVDADLAAARLAVRLPRPTKVPFVWLPAQWPPGHAAATLSEVDEVMG